MKKIKKILISLGCVVLLMISWFAAVNAKSNTEKQTELVNQAAELMSDGIYVRAVPLLEEAAGLRTGYIWIVEEKLKQAYLALFNTHGYRSKYLGLLDQQLRRRDTPASVFIEAANYYLSTHRTGEAFEIFRTGINKTETADRTLNHTVSNFYKNVTQLTALRN